MDSGQGTFIIDIWRGNLLLLFMKMFYILVRVFNRLQTLLGLPTIKHHSINIKI